MAIGWNPPSGSTSIEASETDDLSDITHYSRTDANVDGDLVNVSGSGTLISGKFKLAYQSNDVNYINVTVDGGTTQDISSNLVEQNTDSFYLDFPQIQFDSSLKINISSSRTWLSGCWVKQ